MNAYVPTQAQVVGLIRNLLMLAGAITAVLGVPAKLVDPWISAGMEGAGGLATFICLVWSMYDKRRAGIVANASALPQVRSMTVSDRYLADAAKAADPETIVRIEV